MVYVSSYLMLNYLLLSGYVPPSAEIIIFFFGLFVVFVLAGVVSMWRGVGLLVQQRRSGWVLVLLGFLLPWAGWHLLGSIF